MTATDQTASAVDGQILRRVGGVTKWDDQGDGVITTGEATVPRDALNSTTISMTSGVLRLAYFTARKTETITTLRVPPGAVAAGATPTLIRLAAFSVAGNGDLALLASTANDTTKLASTTSSSSIALQVSWAKVSGTRYAVGLLVVTGAAVPQVAGQNNLPATEVAVAPRLSGTLSGQTDIPASITDASLGNSGSRIYVVAT